MKIRFLAELAALSVAGALAALPLAPAHAAPDASSGAGVPAGISPPAGFTLETIARVPSARELAIAPDGSLVVGTSSADVMLIADPEGAARAPKVFVHIDEAPDAGVAVADDAVFVGTHTGVWRVPYSSDDAKPARAPRKLGSVRQIVSGGHSTTSVAVSGKTLYVGVGSSCNACVERDPSRATIESTGLDGGQLFAKAVRIRNAIALAVDPAGGAVWAGVAGQDELEHGHPYEVFDPFSLHPGIVDYGWPDCYENHRKAHGDAVDCAKQQVPRVVFPAYSTPIGAVFYPLHETGKYAFPAGYAGGAFVTLHGSWHEPPVPPRVAFVALRHDEPAKPVDWDNPDAQWREFVGGFQQADGSRVGRPTGVAVGREGSLFVADDEAGLIYRIRPRR